MLDDALIRDSSRATAGAALPALRTIATALKGTDDEPAAAAGCWRGRSRGSTRQPPQRQRAQLLAAALERKDYRIASAAAGDLINFRLQAGRLAEALQLAEDMIGYTRQAGLGPWTQLSDEVRRLQVLNVMGRARAGAGRGAAAARPHGHPAHHLRAAETVTRFDVRELLLDTGRRGGRGGSASGRRRWN